MSYVMRAKAVAGNYITWISSIADFSGTDAPETIQAGTAIVVMETFEVNLDGYVVGPASAIDNAIARFDLTTGKLIQNSTVTIHDDGHIVLPNSAALYWKSTLGNNVYGLGLAGDNIFRMGVDGYNSYVRGNSVSLCPDDNVKYIFENAQFTIKDQCDIRLNNIANTYYTTFKGADVASNISFTLPTTQGSANQVLNTNGSGQCGWTTLPNFDGYLTTASLLGWGSSLGISNTSDGYTVNLSGNSTLSSINQNITIDPQDGYNVNIGNAGDVLLSTSGTAVTIHNNLIMLNDGYAITATAGENLNITLPADNTTPGDINLIAASTNSFGGGVNAGDINLTAGNAYNAYTGGNVNITAGQCVTGGGVGGAVQIMGGVSTNGTGGSVNIAGSDGETGGSVYIRSGNGSIIDGTINFLNGDGNICAYFNGNTLTGNSTLFLAGESDSSSPGSPGGVVVQGGAATVLGSGGSITIIGGGAQGDGYYGGTISLQPGESTLGTGGSVYVSGADGEIGGNVVLKPGNGSSTDGRIEFQHVDSTVSMYVDTWSKVLFGVNEINIFGGSQTTLIAAGDATIRGGTSSIGNGGHTYVYGGSTTGDGYAGGNISIYAGTSTTNGTGGTTSITGGPGSTGGSVNITGGPSGVAVGGNVNITGGIGAANDGGNLVFLAGAGADGYGGDISITAGDGSDGHTGGQVVISGGGATWGSPGLITITGNDSVAPHRIGGAITLQCGSGSDSGGSVSISSGIGPINGNIDITAGDGNMTLSADNISSTTGAFVLSQDDGSGADFGGHSSVIAYNAYAKENLTPFVMSVPGSLTEPINTREYMWAIEVTDGTAQEFDIDITNLDSPHDGYRTFAVTYDILATNPLGYTGSGCVYQKYYAIFVKDSNNTLHTFGTNYLDVEINSLETHWTLATSAADATTIRLTLDPAARNYRFMIRARMLCTGTYGA